MSHGSTVVSY